MYTDLSYAGYTASPGMPVETIVPVLVEAGLLNDPAERGETIMLLLDRTGLLLGGIIDDGPDPLLEARSESGADMFLCFHSHGDGDAEPGQGDLDQALTLKLWGDEVDFLFWGMVIINNEGQGGFLKVEPMPLGSPFGMPEDLPEAVRKLFLNRGASAEDMLAALDATVEYLTENERSPEDIEATERLADLLRSGAKEEFGQTLREEVEKREQRAAPKPTSLADFSAPLNLPKIDYLN